MEWLISRAGRALGALLIVGLFAGGPAAWAQKTNLEQTSITIGISINDSTFLPIYLAEEEGFFEEAGLKAGIVVFRGGSDLTRALIAKSVEIGVAAPTSVLAAINAGQDIKIFFGGFNQTPFYWYALPSIRSLSDAKGKRFGITRFGSSTDALTRYVLHKAGVNPESDVQIVQGGGSAERLTAMETGQLEATILSYPYNFVAEERDYKRIARQSDAMPDFPIQSLFAKQDFIDGHPQTIKAVLRAVIKGIRLAKSDKDRAVKTLVKRTGLEEKYASLAYDDLVAGWREDGRLASEQGMQAFFDMAKAVGDVDGPWAREKYWDDRFVSTIDEWKPK